jgi:hypothetical protein
MAKGLETLDGEEIKNKNPNYDNTHVLRDSQNKRHYVELNTKEEACYLEIFDGKRDKITKKIPTIEIPITDSEKNVKVKLVSGLSIELMAPIIEEVRECANKQRFVCKDVDKSCEAKPSPTPNGLDNPENRTR